MFVCVCWVVGVYWLVVCLLLFCLLALFVYVIWMLIFCIIVLWFVLIAWCVAGLLIWTCLCFFMLVVVCYLLVRCCICFSYFIGLLRVSLLLCAFLCRLLFFCVFGFCWCLVVLVWFIVWLLLFDLIWSGCWVVIMNASFVWGMLFNSVAIRFIIIGYRLLIYVWFWCLVWLGCCVFVCLGCVLCYWLAVDWMFVALLLVWLLAFTFDLDVLDCLFCLCADNGCCVYCCAVVLLFCGILVCSV